MATISQWIQGARPRTLPAAVAPVLAGVGAAIWDIGFQPGPVLVRGALAMLVSLSLQVGVNYANDYSDGIRGTDDDRVGPFRLTGSRAARPASVKRAAIASLAAGGLFGLILIAIAGIWWTILVGAAAIAAAWFYTGGRKPYGYLGLGELFVFVFFGLVAVNGTAYAITGRLTLVAVMASVAIGLLAVALMLTNNLRDIPTDRESGKRTLAVRLGDQRTRILFGICLLGPFALLLPLAVIHWPLLLLIIVLPLAVLPVRVVVRGATGRALIPVLGAAGRLELLFSVVLLIALVI